MPVLPRLLAEALHSQIGHACQTYGGVVPELASRDHIRRVLPSGAPGACACAGCTLADIDLSWPTRKRPWPGRRLAGGRRHVAVALAAALGKPALGVHHLEGHLLSPFPGQMNRRTFPFVALLVSGGHTQLMRCRRAWADYEPAGRDHRRRRRRSLRQERQAAWAWATRVGRHLAQVGRAPATREAHALPRPLLHSGEPGFFSFAGLKTAVMTAGEASSVPGRWMQQAAADVAASHAGGHRGCAGLPRSRCCALKAIGPPAAGGGRWRGRQPGAARARWMPAPRQAAASRVHYPPLSAVHRQRRHDRHGRGHAGAGRAGRRPDRRRLRRAAALAAGRDLTPHSMPDRAQAARGRSRRGAAPAR